MNTFYIIVLDKNDMGSETLWYVTASSGSIETLKALKNHDDIIVMTLSKPLYPGEKKYQITLLNTHSNQDEAGNIYEVHNV